MSNNNLEPLLIFITELVATEFKHNSVYNMEMSYDHDEKADVFIVKKSRAEVFRVFHKIDVDFLEEAYYAKIDGKKYLISGRTYYIVSEKYKEYEKYKKYNNSLFYPTNVKILQTNIELSQALERKQAPAVKFLLDFLGKGK